MLPTFSLISTGTDSVKGTGCAVLCCECGECGECGCNCECQCDCCCDMTLEDMKSGSLFEAG